MLYVLKSWSFEIWTAELLINVVWVMWRFASYYQLSKKDQLQSWSPSSWSSCSGCQPVQFWVLENHLMMHNLHFLSLHLCIYSPSFFHCAALARDWPHLLHKLPTASWWQRLYNRNCYFSTSSDKKLERSFILHRSLFICDHLSFPSINFLQKESYYNQRVFFCVLLKELFDRDYHFPQE